MKKILLILALSLLLCGCGHELVDYHLDTVPATQGTEEASASVSETKPYREYATYPVERPSDNVIGNTYYYSNSQVISYYDTEIQRMVILCSQPNCTHNSEACTAYLGGNYQTAYQVVGETAYALIDGSGHDGKILFVAQNLVSGERRKLWDLSPEDDDTILEQLNFSIDGDTAFIVFCQDKTLTEEKGDKIHKRTNYGYGLNLMTGDLELLIEAEIPYHPYIRLSGDNLIPQVCTEDYLLIYDQEAFPEEMLSEEEYFRMNPNGDYLAYCWEQWPGAAHYCVNRATGERVRVCGDTLDVKMQDLSVFRDKTMSFVENDEVCIYNGRTGEITRCFKQERIGYQGNLDGRIIFNVYPEDGVDNDKWAFYWYDLTTGEIHQFQKETGTMIFSISGETADHFYGLYKGTNRFISKQDWYNENYDGVF